MAKDVWASFLKWAEAYSGGAYLFRGQADHSPIIPKIARSDYHYSAARERNLFNAFKTRARPFLSVAVGSDWEWLALAQHHGAPTRLTDWSTSPLVAAWFAVTSYPLDSDAAIYALEIERPDIRTIDSSGRKSDKSLVEGPLEINEGFYLIETSPVSSRITTQRGLFVLHAEPTKPLPIAKKCTFEIPRADRLVLQERLLDFGIEASHIFPDLDGLCRSLDWRMRANKGFLAFT